MRTEARRHRPPQDPSPSSTTPLPLPPARLRPRCLPPSCGTQHGPSRGLTLLRVPFCRTDPILPSVGTWWMLTRRPRAVSLLPLVLAAVSILPPQIILPSSSLPIPGRIP